MKQRNRRLVAILCALCMLFTSMPASVWADPMPATPTDLLPVDPAEPEQTETEEAETADPEETEAPEPVKPEVNEEVTGSDDLTVTGSLEGNPPEDYKIRFIPEKDQTLCVILTTDGEVKASVTDETDNTTKYLAFDHTDEEDQTVQSLLYYKVKQDRTYMIRVSGSKPADFTVRLVKMSILKAEEEAKATEESPTEEESASEPAEENIEEPAGTGEEPGKNATEEPEKEPAEEQESAQQKDQNTEPTEESEEEPADEHEPAQQAEQKEQEEETAKEPAEELAEEQEPAQQDEQKEEPAEIPAEEPAEESAEEQAPVQQEEQKEETQEADIPATPTDILPAKPEQEPEYTEAPAETTEVPVDKTVIPADTTDVLAETAEKSAESTEPQPAAETQTETQAEPEPVLEAEDPVEIRIDAADSALEVWITFMSDAGIPQDAVLRIRELTEEEQAAYTARTVRTLKCEDESYLYYTKYLELTLLHDGKAITPGKPVTVSITLPDVSEGMDALQVVRFRTRTAKLLESTVSGNTISFSTESLNVFGIGNALTPLTTQETELASVEVLGFSADAEVSLKQTEAPEVEEGLEVLGSFTVEDQTKAAAGEENPDGLWIKAELNEDAELSPMESVSLYRVEDGQTEVLMEDLSEDNGITELDAQQVAVIRDTGYRHLTLTVNPDENNEDQQVTLDGMMPKEAEAAVTDVTEQYTDCFAAEAAGEEPAQENTAGQEDLEQTDVTGDTSEEESSGTRTTLAAFEISISHSEGEYQPDEDKPISVEIQDSRIAADRNIELWHIKDDGTREQITDFTVEEGRIAFEAAGFSVYVVIDHEGGNVVHPRIMFHFITDDNPDDDNDVVKVQISEGVYYYHAEPYSYKNANNDPQTTQILSSGEALELIADPGNKGDKYFYGWYMVNPHPVSGTADDNGIALSGGRLYYEWPANPRQIIFQSPISIKEQDAPIGSIVHWTLNGVSDEGIVDSDGNVHVLLAPVFEKYNFADFMLYPRGTVGLNANNLMTRKMIAMGSANELEVKISDIRSNSKDPVHLIFIGWEYYDEQLHDWVQIQTVDYSGAEMKDEGRDGRYLTLPDPEDTSSIRLYPIFVEARWLDFFSGVSGSGANYVASEFREAWGTDPANPPEGMTANAVSTVVSKLPVPRRQGYIFEGWYAYAVTDKNTGEITNIGEGNEADITINYILNANYDKASEVKHISAFPITNGQGEIIYNGTFSVDNSSKILFRGETCTDEGALNGKQVLRLYNSLDRLKLYAHWRVDESQIHVIYWTEKAREKGYTAPENPKDDYMPSVVKTITTSQLNTYMESIGSDTRYYSNSTISLMGLKEYKENNVSILAREFLDEVHAVQEGEEKFYDLNETLSDASVTIKGDGSTYYNVYFERKVFKLVFHIGRDGYVKQNGQQKTTADWDGNWIEFMFNDEKVYKPVSDGGLGYTKAGGPGKDNNHNGNSYATNPVFTMTYIPEGHTYTADYVATSANVMGDYVPGAGENVYVITEKYGAYIGDRWPTPVSPNFVFSNDSTRSMYIWAAYYGSLYCGIAHSRTVGGNPMGNNPDINGIYEYMSAELCSNRDGTGIINSNQVHHLVAWYGDTGKAGVTKNYHIYFEAIDGTYDPASATLVSGSDYLGYSKTTWCNAAGDADEIDGHTFRWVADTQVISNLEPEYQLGSEIDGYTLLYSCYYTPRTNEHHIYFFYRPNQYKLTFVYENAEDQKTDWYYYGQPLAGAKKQEYTDPSRTGYYFKGWYLNEKGYGEPFDFANENMPSSHVMLYPVMSVLQYMVKIDPNGGWIDPAALQSTYFTTDYGTPVGEYTIERNFIKLSEKEQTEGDPNYYDPTNPNKQWYYYINMQRIGTPGPDGDWGYPADLRYAVYVTESQLDEYYTAYCDAIRSADPEYWTNIRTLTKQEFINTYTDYPYRRVDGERFTFMGWYQVYDNGSVSTMPYNFNDPVTDDLTLRAKWRLEGGYYLQYNPYFLTKDSNNEWTLVVGEMTDQWHDPANPTQQLYADQSLTHILRAPTNTKSGWVFRGWRVVRKTETSYTTGGTTYYTWEPIERDANNEPVYYQPGDPFIVDSTLVTGRDEYGSIIHLQAFYEEDTSSARRPGLAKLTLDANGGKITTDGSTELNESMPLAQIGEVGTVSLNVDNNMEQVVFDDIQSNTAVHLTNYANNPNYFMKNDYLLLGFDERADENDYIATYPADCVIAVQRGDDEILYAVWEQKVYVTFNNTTDEAITVNLSGTGTDMISIVNRATGMFDRVPASTEIEVPARTAVKIVLPAAVAGTDTFTATVINDHIRKKMSVSGVFGNVDPYGTASEPAHYGKTLSYNGRLEIDDTGIVVTYSEVPVFEVLYDVNGGTWTDESPDYETRITGMYALPQNKIVNNEYEPAEPTCSGKIFVGWTTYADIAKGQSDFSANAPVTWGETTVNPDPGSNILETLMNPEHDYLWDFSSNPPYDRTLYALWSDVVTVTFDITKQTGRELHVWTGPETVSVEGNYSFYRQSPTSNAITYTLKRGEKLPVQPDDPTAGPENKPESWKFLYWLKVPYNINKATGRTELSDRDYIFDFNTPINYNTTLYTSWISKKYFQTYTFTVKNIVVDPVNENEEFEYTISAEDVGMREGNNLVGPTVAFSSATTSLKHHVEPDGEQFVIRITIAKEPSNGTHNYAGYDVYAEVFNREGERISEGHLLNYNGVNETVNDYKYSIKVVQTTNNAYVTNVSTDTIGNTILTLGHDQFTFTSKNGSKYPPPTNPFTEGLNNDKEATITFTNWRKADLTLTKNVEYDLGDRNRDFTFTLESVADEASGMAYPFTKTGSGNQSGEGWLTTVSDSNTFTLKHNESITISLPRNKAIVICEDNTNYTTNWADNNTNNSNLILADADTAAATITLAGNAAATVTNTRQLRTVTVRKVVNSETDTSGTFAFTATLTDGSAAIANFTVNSSDNISTNASGQANFSLVHNGIFELTIPYGATLVVAEDFLTNFEPVATSDTLSDNDSADGSFTVDSITENGTITFTNTPILIRKVYYNVNGGTWTQTASPSFEHLSGNLYAIAEGDIINNQYEPEEPTSTDSSTGKPNKIFLGWTMDADLAAQHDFSGKTLTWGDGQYQTITAAGDCIVLDVLRENTDHRYFWDFSSEPPYDQTLYAVWSDAVTVTFNIAYTSNLEAGTVELHQWGGKTPKSIGTPYEYCNLDSKGRYITYTMAKGEKIPIPSNPSPADNNTARTWNFIRWLNKTQYSNADQYRYTPKDPNETNFTTYAFDFTQRITSDIELVTSWTKNAPQVFTFTIENNVIGGSADDEFDYTIAVSDELVFGKKQGEGNSVHVPTQRWESISTKLRNNQKYTVIITVSYITNWGGANSVRIDVIDRDGTMIKSDQVIYCAGGTYKNFVSDYRYTLTITQDEKPGFKTTVGEENEDPADSIDSSSSDQTRSFTFTSIEQRSSSDSRFSSEVNNYCTGWISKDKKDDPQGIHAGDYSLTIVFTNKKPICKITAFEEVEGVDKFVEHPFYTLQDAIAYINANPAAVYAAPGSSDYTAGDHPVIEMLVSYTMPSTDTVTISANTHVTLTTAKAYGTYQFRESGTTATIRRGFNGDSMFTVAGGATLTLENITLNGNKGTYTSSAQGGLVNAAGTNAAVTMSSGVTLTNSKTTGDGGAVYVADGSTFSMNGGTISNSEAANGAAIYADQGTLNIGGTAQISTNTASGTIGGAINTSSSGATINFSGEPVISDNPASGSGQKNVVLSEDSNTIINVVDTLGSGANIGVYDASGNGDEEGGHNRAGEPFGTRVTGGTGDFSKFVNDKNGLHGMQSGDDPDVLVIWEAVTLTVSKSVTGGTSAQTQDFTFTLTVASDETAPVSYTILKTNQENTTTSGSIVSGGTFTLKHNETALIKWLPKSVDIIVAETAVDDCTTTSSLIEGSGTAVEETGNSRTFTLSDNGTLDFVNTFESQEVIAPTNFSTRHSPWILMLLFGLMLLIGGMGVIRRRGRGNDPDDSGPAACFIRKEGTCLRHSEPNRHSVPEQTCGEVMQDE